MKTPIEKKDFDLDLLCQRDQALMRQLLVDEIRHVICHTNRGILTLQLRKGESKKDYLFVLDSVPLSKESNKEMFSKFGSILNRLI
jgi:hypothetical protein